MNKLRVAGFLEHSFINGEGFRSVLFLSGCPHQCPGCHNEAMQHFDYGETLATSEIISRITKNISIIDGVTLSGGEPFEQSKQLVTLLKALKDLNLSIWAYTGYLYEELAIDPVKSTLLPYIDVLVDGQYLEAYADENLRYRGSSNQRILKLFGGKVEALLNF